MSDKWNFEVIEETEITQVSRGRQSQVDTVLIEAFSKLQKGKAIRIPQLQCDPKGEGYRNEKARVSAMLRTAMRAAGQSDFAIVFTPEGVPQVKIK